MAGPLIAIALMTSPFVTIKGLVRVITQVPRIGILIPLGIANLASTG